MMRKIFVIIFTFALAMNAWAQQPDHENGKPGHARPAAPSRERVNQIKRDTTEQDNGSKSLNVADKVRITPYGFVRNYFTFDSRKTYTVVGGEYNMIPYDEDWNESERMSQATGVERTDLNAVPEARFLSITTRLGLNLDGPMVLGAKSSGKIEADFGGFGTNNTVLRIRHAYLKLSWQHENGTTGELLAGQTWHPLSGDIMPEVLGMAAGAPFRPHSRTPQLRYVFATPVGIGFTAAALYQSQYMYNGPVYTASTWSTYNYNGSWTSAASTDFANQAIIPEVFLGFNYRRGNIYLQLGADVQPIRPRTYGIDPHTGLKVDVNEMFTSCTPTIYFQYCRDKFSVKSRYLFAENTSQVNQLSGYAVTDVADDGTWSYAPLRAHIAYVNFAYGHTFRGNLFFGYMKNVGAGQDLYNFGTVAVPSYLIFMKGGSSFTHLNEVWRVAPSISYNLKCFNVGLEYEVTGASYGKWNSNGSIEDDSGSDGIIVNDDQPHTVVNHRICLLTKYNF